MSSWDYADSAAGEDIQAGDILVGDVGIYHIQKFIGEGCFGKVARCRNQESGDMVAVKILSKKDSERELSMLKAISVLDPDQNNLVKFLEGFEDLRHTCLAFEMLNCDLYRLLEERGFLPLSIKEVRPIALQLLLALDALRGISILHTDIKPDNIMLVQQWPLRVKVIDFGLAMPTSHGRPGLIIQPEGYRAPEIDLGLPFWEPIDMWGVGCILALLYLSDNLFSVSCDYQRMRFLVEVLGQPEDQQLKAGLHTQHFFIKEEAAEGSKWRLMTPEEFTRASGVAPGERKAYFEQPGCLEDLVHIRPVHLAGELEDRRAFVGLLRQMLHVEADQRICPRPALQLPFLTMSHLQQPELRDYLITSKTHMAGCSQRNSDWTPQSSSPPHQSSSTPPDQSSTPPHQSSTPPHQSSSPPDQSSSSPHQSSTPPHQSSSPPDQSSTPPHQSSSTPPHQSSSPPHQSSSTPPHQSSTPPHQSSSPPHQSSSTPPHQSSSTPPHQSSSPPDQSSTPPHQSSSPPAESSSPPHKSSSPPDQFSSPPHNSSSPPDQFSSPPHKSSFPSAESSSPPDQFSTPPHKSSFPSAESSSPPDQFSTPPHKSSFPSAESSSPPDQFSSPPHKSSFPSAESSSPPDQFSTPPAESSSPLDQSSSPPSHSAFPGCLKKLWRIFSSKKLNLCSCLHPSVDE